MRRLDCSFRSGGEELAAWAYLPEAREQRPCV